MALDGVNSTNGSTPPPPSNGADPKSLESMQGRFDDIKGGKSENPKQDLENLQKDVDKAQQDEEKKPGGGDKGKMDMLEQLLKMIMDMLKQVKGGEGGE